MEPIQPRPKGSFSDGLQAMGSGVAMVAAVCLGLVGMSLPVLAFIWLVKQIF